MSRQDPGGETPGGASDRSYEGAKPATMMPGAGLGDWWTAAAWRSNPAMSAALARNWWVVLLRGIFALLFGIVAIALPVATLSALVLLFAVYMLVDGVFAIIAGVRAASRHERWGLLLFEGVVDLVAAAIAFVWPLTTILAVVLLMAAWAVVSGVLMLAATFRLHGSHGRWLMGLGGVVSIVWGFLLISAPLVGAVVLTWWMGGYALFFGGALIVLAFRLRRQSSALQPA